MPAISRDQMFSDMVMTVANRSTCPRANVGAIIVAENRIISMGYNGAPSGMEHCEDVGCDMENDHCVRAIHAEANAIVFAARNGISTKGTALYVTHFPCKACTKLILNSGITEVYFLHLYGDFSHLPQFKAAGITVRGWREDIGKFSSREVLRLETALQGVRI